MGKNKCFNCDARITVKEKVLTPSSNLEIEQWNKYLKIFGNSMELNPFLERTICNECDLVLNNVFSAHQQFTVRTNTSSLVGAIIEETVLPFTKDLTEDDQDIEGLKIQDFIEKRLLVTVAKLSSDISKTIPLVTSMNCTKCTRKFHSKLALKGHWKSVHSPVEKLWFCKLCKLNFSLEWFYKNHLRVAHGEIKIQFPCSRCDRKYESIKDLNKHQLDEHGITTHPFKCDHCEAAFATVQEIRKLRDHLLKFHPHTSEAKAALFNKNYQIKREEKWKSSRFECPYCDEIFSKKLSMQFHELFEHNGQKNCSVCEINFPSSDEMAKHVKSSGHEQKRCVICKKELTKMDGLVKHVNAIHNPSEKKYLFKCEVCGSRFFSILALKSHYRWHVFVASASRFHCNICRKSFSMKSYLALHMRTVHTKRTKDSETKKKRKAKIISNEEKSKIKCEECGGDFKNALSLSQHRRTHVGPIRKKWMLKDVDESKYMIMKEGERRYGCAVCKQDFKRSDHCLRHLWRFHSIKVRDHKSYGISICPICGKKLLAIASLKSHLKTHNKNGPRGKPKSPYSCKLCSNRFKAPKDFSDHMEIIHNALADVM